MQRFTINTRLSLSKETNILLGYKKDETFKLKLRLILFTLIHVQLSVDHVTNNKDELARLANLGLDVRQILRNRRIGNQENTRSIGDYGVKGGYKDFDILRSVSFISFVML